MAEWHLSPHVVDAWTDEQLHMHLRSYVVRKREEVRMHQLASERARDGSEREGITRGANGGTVETRRFTAWDTDVVPQPYPESPRSTVDGD